MVFNRRNFKIVRTVPLTNEISLGTDGDTHTVHHEHTMTFLSSKYFSHGLPDFLIIDNDITMKLGYRKLSVNKLTDM
jgi:hypothetical protein